MATEKMVEAKMPALIKIHFMPSCHLLANLTAVNLLVVAVNTRGSMLECNIKSLEGLLKDTVLELTPELPALHFLAVSAQPFPMLAHSALNVFTQDVLLKHQAPFHSCCVYIKIVFFKCLE